MANAATESPVSLEEYRAMDMARRREVWLEISDITEAEFDAHMEGEKAREATVPPVGSIAPDFVADRARPQPQADRRANAPVRFQGEAGRDHLRLVHLTPLPG